MSNVIFPEQIDHTKELGSYDNPHLDKDNSGYDLIALYLGYQLKYERYFEDYCYVKGTRVETKHWRGNPVYKLGRSKFYFSMWDWDSLHRVLDEMKTREHFDASVQQGLLSLGTETCFNAIIDKLKTLKNV